jgi:PAS domain-containing protein
MTTETDKTRQKLKELRAKAEEKLGSVDLESSSGLTPEVKTLIHELHVYQIELEMQNEELRRAQAALEASRAHYLELYDFAPMGYLTLDADGLIVEINLTASKLLGKDRRDIVTQRFASFIHDDYKDIWYRHFQSAKQNTALIPIF